MPHTATKVPFAEASPAEIREAILPEEHDQFDTSLRQALDEVADTLSLEPLDGFLAHWRRVAWAQNAEGHDQWRKLMARADYTLATGGEWPPTDATAEEIRALLAARQAG